MTDGRDPVSDLEAAADVAQRAVDGVRGQQWSQPSTCEGWSVLDVVRHLVEGNERLAAALFPADPASAPGDTGQGWPERHRSSAAAVVAGLRRPGILGQPVTVPAGTMPGGMVAGLRTVESLVHGWDVARSTGQRLDVPGDLVDRAERLTAQLLERLPPDRHPFAPATTPPAGATALDRLAALLGRQVPAVG